MNTKGSYRKISVENKIKISRRQNMLRSGFSNHRNFKCKMVLPGTSLVVQWLRICLLIVAVSIMTIIYLLSTYLLAESVPGTLCTLSHSIYVAGIAVPILNERKVEDLRSHL